MNHTPSSMHPSKFLKRRELFLLAGAAAAAPAMAQFRVEVTGVGLTQLPIAIAPFRGENELQQKLSAIIQADLERSGRFRAIDPAGASGLDETSRPDLSPWRQKSADSLAVGSATRASGCGTSCARSPWPPTASWSSPPTCASRRTASRT